MEEAKELVVIIRPSFMKFCKDGCRAAAFNHILYWIARKAKGQPQEKIQNGEIAWYATTEEVTEGLANAWGVCKVRQEVNALIAMGIIGRDKNRQWGADRTKHFIFGKEQCSKLLELCQEYDACLHTIGLSADVIHLINLSFAPEASDKTIVCKCGYHQMQIINPSDGYAQANDKSIEAITKVKDTTKVSNKGDDSLAISPQVQIFFTFWKAYRHRKSAATITAKNIEQYETLAAKIQTQEDFDSICALALSRLPSVNDGKLWLANLISCLDDWEMNKEQSQQGPEEQENDYIEGPMPKDTYKLAGRLCQKYHIKLDSTKYVTDKLDGIYKQVRSKSRFERLIRDAGEIAETIEVFLKQLEDAVLMGVEV